ncbi:guanylate cyclase D-like [Haliotis rubra]|uniref:guanylate cyclase D-like n=1 Tax=Haliotis rubra TaxID=36100 RepID=UPI001EE51FD9|nr:guanylate cyclase D-like [Haliotis rubra]XP_046552231.1 guanylate cyclase D-like [Haliotis rubra]
MKSSLVLVALVSAVFCRCFNKQPEYFQHRSLYHNEKNLSIILEGSNRFTHMVANGILKILLEETIGYSVKVNNQNSINATQILNRIFGCPIRQQCSLQQISKDSIPETMVNLEVWMPAGFNEAPWMNTGQVLDCGPFGPSGRRLGWFIDTHTVQEFWKNGTIIDHWRALQLPMVVNTFHWMDKLNTSKYINIDPKKIFYGPRCRGKGAGRIKCATMFSSYQDLAAEVIKEQVKRLNLLVDIVWLEGNLNNFVKEQSDKKAPLLLFSWHPSVILACNNFTRIKLPLCKSDALNLPYDCDFDVNQLNKVVWHKIKSNAPKAYDLISKMTFSQDDYDHILQLHNQNVTATADDIACRWIHHHNSTWKAWMPKDLSNKTKIYLGGLFPISGELWTAPGLVEGGRLAIEMVNRDPRILPEHQLEMLVSDTRCVADEAMRAFIKFITEKTPTSPMAGILGPGCSDTAVPIAALSKHFNMVLVSYGAEASSLTDRSKYPYFFRTIPQINYHRFLYGKLFKQMGWENVGALAESGQEFPDYHIQLQSYLQKKGISVIAKRQIVRSGSNIDVSQIFAELRNRNVRIIIADFYDSAARAVMCEAYRQKMTAYEGYVWFLPAWYPALWWDVDYYNGEPNHNEPDLQENVPCNRKQMETAIEGHFILSKAYPESDDMKESKVAGGITVRQYQEMYQNRVDKADVEETPFASFVYDAVWVFAHGLDRLFRTQPSAISTLHEKATTLKLMEALNETSFQGVSGLIKFNGSDRLGNVTLLQFFNNGTKVVGHYNPQQLEEGGVLDIYKDKIRWLTRDRRQPTDGHTVPSEDCAIERFRSVLGVTSCEMAIIIANVMGFVGFIIITIISLIIIKCRYDAKVRATHERMKELGLLSPDYSHCLSLDDWEIPKENVVLNRKLGEGAFGTVYGGEAVIDGTQWVSVAVKTLKVGAMVEQKLDFFSEADVMKRFGHDNIVQLLAVCTRGEPMYAVMEYLLHGDLKTYLLSRRNLVGQDTPEGEDVSPLSLTRMARDVASGLQYLHDLKYVHRDLACRNCLVHVNKTVKISDFGMTRHTFDSDYYRFTRKGMLPVRWMSPESLVDGIFTSKSDVWSFGVLMYEIATFGSFPYQGYSNSQVLDYVKVGNRLAVPDKCPEDLTLFIYECMSYQPKSRPDITSIINHLENYPEFLVPCLDAPMRSVIMEDTNSLELAMPSVQNTITNSTPVSFLHRRSTASQEKLSPLRKTHTSQGFKFTPLRHSKTYLSAAEKKLRRNSVGTPQALHRETISLVANVDSPLLRTNSFQRHLPSVTCSERGEKDNSSDYFSDTSKELYQTITSV